MSTTVRPLPRSMTSVLPASAVFAAEALAPDFHSLSRMACMSGILVSLGGRTTVVRRSGCTHAASTCLSIPLSTLRSASMAFRSP